ncbi:MAG: hypothetical protein J6Q69_03150 [Clostridia bacterium]|nr:hypothetical protein [Clostridia bacterium]
MKKLLVVLIAVMLFIGCGVCASATESDEIANTTDNIEAPEAEASGEETAGENLFAELYEYACENADNIVSALAFVGSLVLAFFYKKGLMPALSSALGNLRNSVKSFGDTATKSLENSENTYVAVKDSIDLVGKGLDTLCISVAEIDKRLSANEEQLNEAKVMKTIMSAQVDMLYNIFMSSALPQYSKDAVGERISEMRAMLSKTVTENE